MKDHMVSKQISTLVADYLEAILQCKFEKARMGARSVVYNVFEQVQFHLSLEEVRAQILDKHIAKYFDTSDAGDKTSEKILSTNPFLASIVAFIQRRNVETVAVGRAAQKMEKKVKDQILDADVKHVTQNSVSPPSRTNSVPSSSTSNKDDHLTYNRWSPERPSRSPGRDRRHKRARNARPHQADRTNRTSHPLAPRLTPT